MNYIYYIIMLLLFTYNNLKGQNDCNIPIIFEVNNCGCNIELSPPFKSNDTSFYETYDEENYTIYLYNCLGKAIIFKKNKSNNLVAKYEFSESLDTLTDYSFYLNPDTFKTKAVIRKKFKALPTGTWIFYNDDGTIKNQSTWQMEK